MYAIVLATALTAGSAAPELGWWRGCHGCHGCHGCYVTFGCYGCHGCWGCYGCYGCGGCLGSCYSCYACSGCFGCHGCFACYSYAPAYPFVSAGCGCFGCFGCWGCTGIVSVAPAAAPPQKMDKAGEGDKGGKGDEIRTPATVVVKAPADVTITVNGQVTTRRTTEETFVTPALVSGREYAYLFTGEAVRNGRKISQTRRITVRAGEQSSVDFTNLEAAPAVARVTIVLPEKANLKVNGVAVSAARGTQVFETPTLETGRRYFYTVQADIERDGRTVTTTRRVEVEAGKEVKVDFTPPAIRTASR